MLLNDCSTQSCWTAIFHGVAALNETALRVGRAAEKSNETANKSSKENYKN